jgi:hypothetical protein
MPASRRFLWRLTTSASGRYCCSILLFRDPDDLVNSCSWSRSSERAIFAMAQACPGVMPTTTKLAVSVFGTTAQYSPKNPGTAASGWSFPQRLGLLPNTHRSQIEEKRIHSVLPGMKSHFLPSRFLSGSRAWKFRERFGALIFQANAI